MESNTDKYIGNELIVQTLRTHEVAILLYEAEKLLFTFDRAMSQESFNSKDIAIDIFRIVTKNSTALINLIKKLNFAMVNSKNVEEVEIEFDRKELDICIQNIFISLKDINFKENGEKDYQIYKNYSQISLQEKILTHLAIKLTDDYNFYSMLAIMSCQLEVSIVDVKNYFDNTSKLFMEEFKDFDSCKFDEDNHLDLGYFIIDAINKINQLTLKNILRYHNKDCTVPTRKYILDELLGLSYIV